MRCALLIFLFLLGGLVYGQVSFSIKAHDFGELLHDSQRFIDIEVTNKSNQTFSIFSIRLPNEVATLISSKKVAPDSTAIIRLQVNPKQKGQFNYKIEVFTSNQNEPTIIILKGNMVEYDANSNYLFTTCPSFSAQPTQSNPTHFDLRIQTIDAETKAPIENSEVTLIQKGQILWTLPTDEEGKIKKEAHLGISYFQAKHPEYQTVEIGQYINFKRNEIVLELKKDTLKPVIPEENIAMQTEIKEETEELQVEQEIAIVESTEPETTLLSNLDPNNFDENLFKPVNVVFILDISSSMKHADRIELMKYALMQLAEMLRAQDQFSIITYASTVEVLLPPTSGDSKSLIKEKIANLDAGGLTSGGLGIKLGYETAKNSFLKEGANHVIIITDGSFNQNSSNYKRIIKKYRKKGITFSVVGIKNKPSAEQEMREDAALGGGDYVPILELSDAQNNLKQEIRKRAFRY